MFSGGGEDDTCKMLSKLNFIYYLSIYFISNNLYNFFIYTPQNNLDVKKKKKIENPP